MRGRGTVWLVGMMGAGKSSVGAELARRLDCPFVDSDAEVERSRGASISQIFEREGEAAFRAREAEVIEKLRGQACVVALGGGAIAQPGAAERLASSGTVVYLRARPESLLLRLGHGEGRPLLEGLGESARLEKLRGLLGERAVGYETAALAIDTDALEVAEVAARLERLLRAQAAS